MPQVATTQAAATTPLELYTVMSPWHPDDSEQGTFEENVWATSHEDAERELAARMAMSTSGCSDDESVDEWIANHLEACQHLMVTTRVIDSIQSTLLDLLSGPDGEATPEVKTDLTVIMNMLSKRRPATLTTVAPSAPCACWPGRLCDRQASCAAEVKAAGG